MLYFLLFLGGLIFFHELGHYLVARLVWVTVIRFSIGFGPRIVGFKRGVTEYRLSLLPLGGYVQFLGSDPEDPPPPGEEKHGFLTTDTWRKVLIVLAGPVFNLILPFLIFFPMFLGQATLPPAVLGATSMAGPAWEAGLRPGDRVLRIDDRPIEYWWEMLDEVSTRPGVPLVFEVARDGRPMTFTVVPRAVELAGLKEIGLERTVGRIEVTLDRALPVVVPDPDSPAAAAGIEPFDAVVSIDGRDAIAFDDVTRALAVARDRAVALVLARTEPDSTQPGERREVVLGPLGPEVAAGLRDGGMVVHSVAPDSPAARAGIQPGDGIASLDGQPSLDWSFFVESLARDPAATRRIEVVRDGATVALEVSLANPQWQPGAAVPKCQRFGASVRRAMVTPDPVPNQARLRFALHQTWRESVDITVKTVASIGALVTGRVSVKEMGGPIMIYDIASSAGERGWVPFFEALAWLSVSLGVLNLLPIPVLDGGHLVVFGIEAIRRKPLGTRGRVILNYIGLAFLLALMVVVFSNDIARKWGSLSQLRPPG
jgi:regulator of sigma E protease